MRHRRWLRFGLLSVPIMIWIYVDLLQGMFSAATVEKSQTEQQSKVKKWITLCDSMLWGDHRTGNHLFILAAMMHLAQLTNRTLIMPRKGWKLDRVFNLHVERFNNSSKEFCPCRSLKTPRYDYDKRFDDIQFIRQLTETNDTILFCGLSQTYKHAEVVEKELRRQLKFPAHVSHEATKILKQAKASGRNVNIGVHVRRGDFLQTPNIRAGLTVADTSYFNRSFDYFISRHSTVRFFVETDDFPWCVKNLPNISSTAEIRFSRGSQEVDLAVLSMCDGIILSTGTFGWWGGWLAKRTTVYYNGWPRNGSALHREFNKKNYFIPEWIPL